MADPSHAPAQLHDELVAVAALVTDDLPATPEPLGWAFVSPAARSGSLAPGSSCSARAASSRASAPAGRPPHPVSARLVSETADMGVLVDPDVRYHASWLRSAAEFGGAHMDGSGTAAPDRAALAALADPGRFAAQVADLLAGRLPDTPRPPDRVPATSLWIVEGEEHVGFLQIRHCLNDFLLEQGGHIGYSVRPGARRRGHARAALRDALPIAASLGIERALVTCDEANTASRATIEGNGGVYEDSRAGKRRYWLTTD